MKFLRTLALLGAVLTVAWAASAQAATTATVRVEGKSRALLGATVVHLKNGWLTHDGAPNGGCSTDSAAGALDQATHHRWSGSFSTKYSDYLIDSILGEKYGSTASYYWEIFADNVMASSGACGIKPHRGEQLLFAAVSLADTADYPLAITGAPRHASVGHAFAVKVVYYDAKGKARPLAGAVLVAGGQTVTTNARGVATVTPTHGGKLVLQASHAATHKGKERFGYIRAAALRLTVA